MKKVQIVHLGAISRSPIESKPLDDHSIVVFDGTIKTILQNKDPNKELSLYFESTLGDVRIPRDVLKNSLIFYVSVD